MAKAKAPDDNGKPALEIEDIQAIRRVRVELPEPGGVVVWTGDHGTGKTTSVRCVAALTSPEVRRDLRPRDGCEHGTIKAPGIVVRIGRKATAKGELTFSAVDSECDPSVLVNPGIKDPLRADAARLRMLVGIGGVEVSGEQWGCHLAGYLEDDRVREIIAGLPGDDPVQASEIVRTRVHELAKAKEKAAVQFEASAIALAEQVEGLDLAGPCDAAELQKSHDAALVALSRLESEYATGVRQNAQVEDARVRLIAVASGLPDLEAIQCEIRVAEQDREAAQRAIADIDQQIRDLQNKRAEQSKIVGTATAASEAARQRLRSGKAQHAAVADLRATVERGCVVLPSEELLSASKQAKDAAAQAVLAGEAIRKGREIKGQAEAAKQRADQTAEQAKELRTLARSVELVLEEALRDAGFLGLTWREGRLYVESDRGLDGHLELFEELSEGERYRRAFDWIAQKLPESAFVPLSQEAWQGLSRASREEIHAMCRARKLWLWTGEIGDGELRPVLYPVGEE